MSRSISRPSTGCASTSSSQSALTYAQVLVDQHWRTTNAGRAKIRAGSAHERNRRARESQSSKPSTVVRRTLVKMTASAASASTPSRRFRREGKYGCNCKVNTSVEVSCHGWPSAVPHGDIVTGDVGDRDGGGCSATAALVDAGRRHRPGASLDVAAPVPGDRVVRGRPRRYRAPPSIRRSNAVIRWSAMPSCAQLVTGDAAGHRRRSALARVRLARAEGFGTVTILILNDDQPFQGGHAVAFTRRLDVTTARPPSVGFLLPVLVTEQGCRSTLRDEGARKALPTLADRRPAWWKVTAATFFGRLAGCVRRQRRERLEKLNCAPQFAREDGSGYLARSR